eukprot:31158_2
MSLLNSRLSSTPLPSTSDCRKRVVSCSTRSSAFMPPAAPPTSLAFARKSAPNANMFCGCSRRISRTKSLSTSGNSGGIVCDVRNLLAIFARAPIYQRCDWKEDELLVFPLVCLLCAPLTRILLSSPVFSFPYSPLTRI